MTDVNSWLRNTERSCHGGGISVLSATSHPRLASHVGAGRRGRAELVTRGGKRGTEGWTTPMGEKARPRTFEGWSEGQGGYGKVRLGGQKGRKWVKGSRDSSTTHWPSLSYLDSKRSCKKDCFFFLFKIRKDENHFDLNFSII